MQVATHSGLGFYVNEMQRTINGAALGTTGIIPYGHFSPYQPGAIARGLGETAPTLEERVQKLERVQRVGIFTTVATTFAIVALSISVSRSRQRGGGY